MMRARLPLLLVCLALAASCTTASLKELRRTAPKGSPFQSAISALYLEYAESEAAQYDWATSQYFADKGLLAAYGNDVPPEMLEGWAVPQEKKPELMQARETLLAYLASGAVQAAPAQAAKAQYYFDCWVEQQHEAWQEDDIESCRQGFYGIVRAPVAAPVPVVAPLPFAEPVPLAAPVAVAPPVAAPVQATAYVLLFDKGTGLLPDSARTLETLQADLRKRADHIVILNGHSDREGEEQANLDMSQKRVDFVKARLVQGGIPAARIQSFAFGESDPVQPTADGVAAPANRRVEIFINP